MWKTVFEELTLVKVVNMNNALFNITATFSILTCYKIFRM
jgi:hypothetical protein